MAKRIAVIQEASPGLVHITSEALHELMTECGWREVETDHDDTRRYVREFANPARPAHPNTMAGRGPL